MRILILHNLEDLSHARKSALDYVLAYQRYAPEHDYLYHRITLPVTRTLAATPWDAVIFDSTSLGICTFRPRELFYEHKAEWFFLADSPAVKLVLPQDDANCGALMDEWFAELKCDAIFTVRPEFKDLIYPRSSPHSDVISTFSGFVDDLSLPVLRSYAKPFAERRWDIGQRVTMYPPRGGRHARLKGVTARNVKRAAEARGLRVDVSTSEEDILLGSDWYRFLGDCRFVIGAEGGMSIWDPYGEIADRIEAYTADRPDADFEEIEAACFPNEDGRYVFAGFSPRLFEAAIMGCCQILVEGEYRGILRPYEHYIPLKRDCSNIEEVFRLMQDEAKAERRIRATYQTLVEDPQYRFSNFVSQVMDYIRNTRRVGRTKNNDVRFDAIALKHRAELQVAVSHRAESEGFDGEALVQRVESLLGGQFMESEMALDRHDASLSRQNREALKHRVQLHLASRKADRKASEDMSDHNALHRLMIRSGLRAALGQWGRRLNNIKEHE